MTVFVKYGTYVYWTLYYKSVSPCILIEIPRVYTLKATVHLSKIYGASYTSKISKWDVDISGLSSVCIYIFYTTILFYPSSDFITSFYYLFNVIFRYKHTHNHITTRQTLNILALNLITQKKKLKRKEGASAHQCLAPYICIIYLFLCLTHHIMIFGAYCKRMQKKMAITGSKIKILYLSKFVVEYLDLVDFVGVTNYISHNVMLKPYEKVRIY